MTQDTKKEAVNEAPAMTAADAAKLVRREMPVLDKDRKPVFDKDGQPTTKQVAIKTEEVLNFAAYPEKNKVVVVTTNGEKLVGELTASK